MRLSEGGCGVRHVGFTVGGSVPGSFAGVYVLTEVACKFHIPRVRRFAGGLTRATACREQHCERAFMRALLGA